MKRPVKALLFVVELLCLFSCVVKLTDEDIITPPEVVDPAISDIRDTLIPKDKKTSIPETQDPKVVIDDSYRVNIMNDVVDVSAGRNFTLAIKKDGSLWAWGGNEYGQLGDGTNKSRTSPVKIMDDVIAISAGYGHSLAIKKDGTLWAWGANALGQLGNGQHNENNKDYDNKPNHTYDVYIPIKIMDDVYAISAGYSHSMVIKEDYSLWTWGSNNKLQLFIEYENFNQWTKRPIDTFFYDRPIKVMDDIVMINAGYDYSMIGKADGSLLVCGDNHYGQLGTNDHGGGGYGLVEIFPKCIMKNVFDVSSYSHHTMIIKNDNSLWACGANNFGQLGNGKGSTESKFPYFSYDPDPSVDSYIPIKIMNDVMSVSTGVGCTLALKTDNSLWSWGNNYFGQLGNGTNTTSCLPLKIMEDVIAVSAGENHTAAIKIDGSLWVWGSNKYGQLGLVEEKINS